MENQKVRANAKLRRWLAQLSLTSHRRWYLLCQSVVVANDRLSLQHQIDNLYRPDENEFEDVTQHISVSMKDQNWDYFQPEFTISQIIMVPHNNGSHTPQDVRGGSGMDPSMDPSSSRAHGTEPKYMDKDCFF